MNSKLLYLSSQREKEHLGPVFPSSIEREMRKFYVVVVQRRQSNVQKKRDARGKLLFRLSKPIAFFPVLIVFAVVVALSSLLTAKTW